MYVFSDLVGADFVGLEDLADIYRNPDAYSVHATTPHSLQKSNRNDLQRISTICPPSNRQKEDDGSISSVQPGLKK